MLLYSSYFSLALYALPSESEKMSMGSPDSYADNSSRTKTILIIILIIVLVCVTGVLCYFLGKNLNKMRKKKANELADDEYDYTSKSEKEEVN